jgi:hypothetical protein
MAEVSCLTPVTIWLGPPANLADRNLGQLRAPEKTRLTRFTGLTRMQHRRGLIASFLATTGLDLTPFL